MAETILFEGPVSQKTKLWTYVLCAIVPVVGWVAALFVFWGVKSTRYKITTDRVEVTTGILSRDVDSVLLWRVRDVRFHQSLMDRVLGLAEVTLSFLDDAEGGVLSIRGLPDARALYEQLVTAVDSAARARRATSV